MYNLLQSYCSLKTEKREVKYFFKYCNFFSKTAKRLQKDRIYYKKNKNNLKQTGSTQLIPYPKFMSCMSSLRGLASWLERDHINLVNITSSNHMGLRAVNLWLIFKWRSHIYTYIITLHTFYMLSVLFSSYS